MKKLLKLTCYDVEEDGTISIRERDAFSVMLNPSEIKHEFSVSYNHDKKFGQKGSDSKFAAINAEKVSFAIVLDGTGAVSQPDAGPERGEVHEQVDELRKVVYEYDGKQHQPRHVRVLWGTFIFFGRLESMSTQYTLFAPGGAPLRAKIDMRFIGAMSKREQSLTMNQSSPDLSHHVLVKAGDTLPLLCHQVYGDPAYYPDVARFNGLTLFRDLEPGRELHFPPLR